MIKEYFAIALRSVLAHKIRALLTTLGVIIGVASVILLMSLGNSAREEAANQTDSVPPSCEAECPIFSGRCMSGYSDRNNIL